MSLITSIEKVRETATSDGFLLFCEENGIDAENYVEPEEGLMIGSFDLLRYETYHAYADLKRDIDTLIDGRSF